MPDQIAYENRWLVMKNDSSWYIEDVRRKTLATINIAKEVGKHNLNAEKFQTPSEKQIHERFKSARDLSTPSFGMTVLGLMLTLFSVVMVSSCFITTIDSYDLAVQNTNQMGIEENSRGEALNPYPVQPPFVAVHFASHHHLRLKHERIV